MKTEIVLHSEFVKLGNDRRKLTNELLALLPEIYERGVFRKYAATIVEYAGKFGGLSKGVVIKRLRLEKYLVGKPLLKEAIKTEGVHKVALVANLATHENANLVCKAVPSKLKIELDEELTGLFLQLKKKFGGNLGNKEVVKKIFEMALKDKKVIPEDGNSQSEFPLSQKPVSRYIPTKIKKLILAKSSNQCSYPNCNKPAEIFHHTERFAEKPNHGSLITLCKIHHEFAHNNLIENEKQPMTNWKLNFKTAETGEIDNLYRFYRSKLHF